ncbi:MAG: hypothetical protein IJP65_03590, partial [Bacteroidales bacterium]|nr:hypothetical protein [Bacteroidales bacterium]
SNGNGYLSEKQINNHFFCQKNIEMECRKQLCEKCKKKEDDYFLVTLSFFPFYTKKETHFVASLSGKTIPLS